MAARRRAPKAAATASDALPPAAAMDKFTDAMFAAEVQAQQAPPGEVDELTFVKTVKVLGNAGARLPRAVVVAQ